MTNKRNTGGSSAASIFAAASILPGLRICLEPEGLGGVANDVGFVPAGPADIDVIRGNGGGAFNGSGSVAMRLLQSGFNPQSLRSNATLRYDEWRAWDQIVLEVARIRLVAVGDMYGRGLVTNLPNALGHTVFSWQRMSDFTPAEMTMSGLPAAEKDRMEFDYANLPIPIIHKDFSLNIRELAASRNKGMPLDTLQISYATRVVTEKIESLLFNGSTALGTNNTIYGLLTTPNRLTGSVTASWASATGAQIVTDCLTILAALRAQLQYGPFGVYVSDAAFTHMGDDFKANGDRTILERVLAIPGIAYIKPSTFVATGAVVFVQLSKETVDIINGFQPMVVEWESHGGMVTNYKVMAIQVPRMRTDFNGNKGIAHYS
jgi:uncharacterized linocin/CFP29 family protein